MKRALFIGRFQPFHKGHLQVVKDISKKYDDVIIGIGSSQEKFTKENPFSYSARKIMISNTLKNNKIKNIKIYPIPDLYNDKKWVDYVRNNLPKFDAVYTGNKWTYECFKKFNFKVKKIRLVRGINSTIIRERMANGKPWKNLVPKEIYAFIVKINGVERLKKLR